MNKARGFFNCFSLQTDKMSFEQYKSFSHGGIGVYGFLVVFLVVFSLAFMPFGPSMKMAFAKKAYSFSKAVSKIENGAIEGREKEKNKKITEVKEELERIKEKIEELFEDVERKTVDETDAEKELNKIVNDLKDLAPKCKCDEKAFEGKIEKRLGYRVRRIKSILKDSKAKLTNTDLSYLRKDLRRLKKDAVKLIEKEVEGKTKNVKETLANVKSDMKKIESKVKSGNVEKKEIGAEVENNVKANLKGSSLTSEEEGKVNREISKAEQNMAMQTERCSDANFENQLIETECNFYAEFHAGVEMVGDDSFARMYPRVMLRTRSILWSANENKLWGNNENNNGKNNGKSKQNMEKDKKNMGYKLKFFPRLHGILDFAFSSRNVVENLTAVPTIKGSQTLEGRGGLLVDLLSLYHDKKPIAALAVVGQGGFISPEKKIETNNAVTNDTTYAYNPSDLLQSHFVGFRVYHRQKSVFNGAYTEFGWGISENFAANEYNRYKFRGYLPYHFKNPPTLLFGLSICA